jgi:TPR repeat protein
MRLKYLPALAFVLSSLVPGSLIAQQGPPPPEKGSVSAMIAEAISGYTQMKTIILASAEKMPAENFSFKPTLEVRSYGEMYDLGQGVHQDYPEALRWYSKAVDQGDANAQCGLGSMYYDGRGIRLDRAVAASWYRQAADRGLARAQYDLGYMYY